MKHRAVVPVVLALAGLFAGCGSEPAATEPDAATDGSVDVGPSTDTGQPTTDVGDDLTNPVDGPLLDVPANRDAMPDTTTALDVPVVRDAPRDLPADGPWDPHSGRPPHAKGIWIWYFTYTGYTAAQLATRCQAMGVGYVLIKSGQDGSYWDTRYNAASVREFTSRGLQVFAWPYVTPRAIAASVTAIAQAARVPGTSGVILDVEIEFEGSYASQAQTLCQGIRSAVPGVFLGYTSFGWVGYHGTLPFATFDRYCGDVFMPQVYWSDRGVAWRAGYDQALSMIHSAGLHAPVWTIESNDDIYHGGAPTTADLNAYFDTAGPFTSLWEWPASGLAAKVTQLSSLHWAN